MKKTIILLITMIGLFSSSFIYCAAKIAKTGNSLSPSSTQNGNLSGFKFINDDNIDSILVTDWDKFKINPYILNDINHLNNYLSQYNIARFGIRDYSIHNFIISLQNHMVYSIEGKHTIEKAGEILDIVQRYIKLEKKYTTEMANLDEELKELTK